MASAATPTRKRAGVSASSTIQPEHLRVAEPDAPGGITRSRLAMVLPGDTPDHSLGNTTDVSAFLADSINQLRRGQLDPRVANAMGYLTSVLLRSLEQGPVEERLAKIEATLAGNAQEAKSHG